MLKLSSVISQARHVCNTSARRALVAAFALTASAPALAASFVAYPGVYPIAVIEVRDAKTFYVNAAVWPGFERNFVITQPGIDIPSNAIRAPACGQKLAAKAKAFTARSEERRGGTGGVSTVRFRWAPEQKNNKNKNKI